MYVSSKKHQRGITLIEIMIGIAIALVVATIAIGLAVAARRDAVTHDLQNQMLRINEVATSLAPADRFTGLTTAVLCTTGKLDGLCSTVNGSTTMTGAHGGELYFEAAPSGDGAILQPVNVHTSTCVALATNLSGSFRRVQIGPVLIKDGASVAASPSQIASACSSDGDQVQAMAFYLGRPSDAGNGGDSGGDLPDLGGGIIPNCPFGDC